MIRIRESEDVNSMRSILVVIPGFQESPSSCPHGPRFSWEERPTSKASSFCKTQPSNCGKVPLSLSSLSSLFSCFFWSHVSRAEAWLCLFFLGCWWNPQVSLLGLSLWLVTSFFSFCSHFGEARALPGDAVRPAGNQAQNISPSQRILVWRYSRFPTLLPFRMQTMCHSNRWGYQIFNFGEAKVGSRSATKCSPGHIARSVSWVMSCFGCEDECLENIATIQPIMWFLDSSHLLAIEKPEKETIITIQCVMCVIIKLQLWVPAFKPRSCSRPLARLRADAWWKAEKKDGRKLTRGLEKGPRGGMLKCFSVFFHEMYGWNADLGTLMVKGLPQCSMWSGNIA